MKKLCKLSASLLACACLLLPTANTFAASSNNNITVPYTDSVSTYENTKERSKKIPSSSSSVNLSYGTKLAFRVDSLRYGNLFTNNRFTGVNSIKVKISSITVDKNGSAFASGNLKVTLYKNNYTKVSSKSISIKGGTLTFNGLSKNTKYYLEFSKNNDGQYYKFNGSITSND